MPAITFYRNTDFLVRWAALIRAAATQGLFERIPGTWGRTVCGMTTQCSASNADQIFSSQRYVTKNSENATKVPELRCKKKVRQALRTRCVRKACHRLDAWSPLVQLNLELRCLPIGGSTYLENCKLQKLVTDIYTDPNNYILIECWPFFPVVEQMCQFKIWWLVVSAASQLHAFQKKRTPHSVPIRPKRSRAAQFVYRQTFLTIAVP